MIAGVRERRARGINGTFNSARGLRVD
jgi:hypothetical protein